MLKELFRALRPQQWIKNLFVFAPLIFSQNVLNRALVFRAGLAFVSFCLISSAVYLINDLRDIEEDRQHPVKSQRPLASGRLKKSAAVAALAVLVPAGFLVALLINRPFTLVALGYFVLQIAYTLWLKHVVILDIFVVAAGFLLRVVAGGLAISVYLSSWLLLCTALLALFLAMGKRRHELVLMEGQASNHRPILKEYSTYLLDQMISVVTASTVITYTLYTVSEDTVSKFGTDRLKYTIPFVLYGIFRYLYLIHQKNEGGSPEKVMLNDLPLLVCIMLYGITVGLILYY